MKEKKLLGYSPKYEKPTQSRQASDYVIFGPLGLAVSPQISVLGMFLIGLTSALLAFIMCARYYQLSK